MKRFSSRTGTVGDKELQEWLKECTGEVQGIVQSMILIQPQKRPGIVCIAIAGLPMTADSGN